MAKDPDAFIDEILDEVDDAVELLSRDAAKELIDRLRDELTLRADDFDGYYGAK